MRAAPSFSTHNGVDRGSVALGERVATACLFFGSGFAGLIYQVSWMRELGLLFGNTSFATATTLAAFFLGLAAGGVTFGRRAARAARCRGGWRGARGPARAVKPGCPMGVRSSRGAARGAALRGGPQSGPR